MMWIFPEGDWWLTPWDPNVISPPEIYSEDHESSIFRQSSNPVCGLSMMEQVRLCAVWPTENRLGSSMNYTQDWMTV